ncbi:hypothetical protein [Methylobacterium sp. Leaf465]|uniref:hypothetical protein n=1 Tax=Methylobacterium sp. Leaf465 TaxID=1736385 RepID=UPI0012E3E08B|nr:hypothetical protein [Methylobacterium sp. Leaf465]
MILETRGIVLQSLARVIICIASVCSLAGCNDTERGYLNEGAGISLFADGGAHQSQLQEIYLGNICRQANLLTAVQGEATYCDFSHMGSAEWSLLVQTGMNDIDARCDGYLAWLDSRRRSTSIIQQQLLDTQTAVNALMIATQAGGQAISIAGASLGFASHTFTNINSRLLFEIEQSTVQAVVLSRQNQFRTALPRHIDNKAAAIYALRSYLRLCMPMTIETQINTTIKLYERAGLDALADAQASPLVDSRRVRSAVIADAAVPMSRPQRATRVPESVRRGDFELSLRHQKIRSYRAFLKLPCDGGFTAEVRSGILSYLNTNSLKDQNFPHEITGTDDRRLRSQSGFVESCVTN